MIKIVNSNFITSATSIDEAPVTNLPEFVMVGRSNVGKSSFINALCNRKRLAYVGKLVTCLLYTSEAETVP